MTVANMEKVALPLETTLVGHRKLDKAKNLILDIKNMKEKLEERKEKLKEKREEIKQLKAELEQHRADPLAMWFNS